LCNIYVGLWILISTTLGSVSSIVSKWLHDLYSVAGLSHILQKSVMVILLQIYTAECVSEKNRKSINISWNSAVTKFGYLLFMDQPVCDIGRPTDAVDDQPMLLPSGCSAAAASAAVESTRLPYSYQMQQQLQQQQAGVKNYKRL